MSENLDKIKQTIRKLLAKADNTACSVQEAQAFNDKAFELMEKYNFERATVEQEKEALRTHKTLTVLVRPWSSAVLHGLAHLYYCKWYFTKSGRSDVVTLVGEESNVAVCHAIAVMVLRAVQQEARITGGGRSFMTGAGSMIYRRCLEMRPKQSLAAPTTSTGNALVVLSNQEDDGNRQYIAKLTGGALRQSRSTGAKVSNSGAYGEGSRFGASLPLRQNLLGGG